MKIDVNKQGTVCTIALEGRLDSKTAPELEEVLEREIDGITELHFNFEKLQYMSGPGLRVILSAHCKMQSRGCMVIHQVNDMVMEIFRVVGVQNIFTIVNEQ